MSLKWFCGVGDFGFNLMSSMETFFFQHSLTNIAMFASPLVTTITTIGSMVDVALSWMYGVTINKISLKKGVAIAPGLSFPRGSSHFSTRSSL
jgi:hypothetical protein